MFGSYIRLPVAAAAAFILSLGCGVLISQAGSIASLLGFPGLAAAIGPSTPLQIASAVILSVGVYASIASILTTVAICFDLWSIRGQLNSLIASGGAALLRAGDWHLLFFGAVAEALGLRLVAKGQDADGNLFCVAGPFSPGQARREIWRFYGQSLARCQVWSALGLLLLAALALFAGSRFEILQDVNTALPVIGETVLGLTLFIGISVAAASEVFERVLDTLSSFPFKLESSLRLDLIARQLDRNSRATGLGFEPGSAPPLDNAAAEIALDPLFLRHSFDELAARLTSAMQQKITRPLEAAENRLAASAGATERLDEQLGAISRLLREGFTGQREDVIRSIDAAHLASRESVQELAAALHAMLEETSQRRIDRQSQNGEEQDIERATLTAAISGVTNSVEGFQTSISSLLQARGATDEHLAAAAVAQRQVLEGCRLIIVELNETMRAVQTALSEQQSISNLPTSRGFSLSIDQLADKEIAESHEIVEELNSLLREFDRAPGVASA